MTWVWWFRLTLHFSEIDSWTLIFEKNSIVVWHNLTLKDTKNGIIYIFKKILNPLIEIPNYTPAIHGSNNHKHLSKCAKDGLFCFGLMKINYLFSLAISSGPLYYKNSQKFVLFLHFLKVFTIFEYYILFWRYCLKFTNL